MKKDGHYRFNLQFPAETEEQIQVGELLERLGNRKSAVVVTALGEYLAAHPTLYSPECKVEITTVRTVSPKILEEMIEKMLDERKCTGESEHESLPEDDNSDISEMLNNMDIFQ